MAKYNILDEDDIFSESGEELEKPEKKKTQESSAGPEIQINEEDFFDDSLLAEEKRTRQEPDEIFGQDAEENLDIEIEEEKAGPGNEDDIKEFFKGEPKETPGEQRRGTPARPRKEFQDEQQKEVRQIIEDYEDSHVEGLNYKPFVIGGIIIILIVAVYFILDIWVFGAKKVEEPVADQTEVVQQPQISPEQLRKNQILAQLAGKTSHELSVINDIIKVSNQKANLSSLLLYENSFLLEVFTKDRGDLAGLQRQLKQNLPNRKFQIVTSDVRPGDNGGIFGLYSIEINGTSSEKEVTQNFGSVQEAKNWLSSTSTAAGAKIKTFKELGSSSKENFNIFEVETQLSGSLDNCQSVLQNIAGAHTNIKIHKLNMTALDQRAFKKSNFQLKIVLQIYV